jgi:pteridine reductase
MGLPLNSRLQFKRSVFRRTEAMQKPGSLQGKVALVTGAAHRIGAQIARTLHENGMNLVVHYRRSAEASQALQRELERDRPDSVALAQADLLETDRLQALADAGVRRFGRLDLLVNNASSFYPTPVGQFTENDWNDLSGSNLKAPLFLAQAAAPALRKTGGAIVNLVDIHAERPLKDYPLYSIAKAGNAMMVKALARELGPDIRVNGIAPGAILWPENELSQTARDEILARTALKRAGSPKDIAATLVFLVRDAPYITGQIIAVDGGRTLQH